MNYWRFSKIKNSIFIAQERSQYLGLKTYIPFCKKGYHQKIFRAWIKINLSYFSIGWSFHRLISQKNLFWTWIKIVFSHFLICWYFSFIFIYHIFKFYYYFVPWARKLTVFTNIINQKYLLQHSRKLFNNIQLLVHYLQVIPYKHLSRLDLTINTLLPIRTIKTSRIQMTSSTV